MYFHSQLAIKRFRPLPETHFLMKKLLLACCACLLFSSFHPAKALAQFPTVGVAGEIPLGKLDEMEQMLAQADGHQKAGLLARLGIDSACAKNAAESLLPGQAIALRPLRERGATHYGIVFLPSGTGACSFLYLLQGSDEEPRKDAWHAIGQQTLDCWDMACSFEIMPLRSADVDDVVVHRVNLGHGSGYAEDQTQVYSVLDGKLLQTLATEDSLIQETWGTDITLNRSSTFQRFPGQVLEETRSSSDNDKLKKVERRYWRWSERKRRFFASPFHAVVAPRAD
jgi:hypothetical protein